MKTEAKWTRGPWRVVLHDHGQVSVIGPDGGPILDAGRDDWSEEAVKANRDLIAAAPDLAEALERVMEYYDPWSIPDGGDAEVAWIKARAALRKARGE